MGYSRAVKVGILKKVLPPESRSIAEISRESGVNQQTIRNWIKQHESGAFNDLSAESCLRSQHLEERRRMMQAWADYLDGLKGAVLK